MLKSTCWVPDAASALAMSWSSGSSRPSDSRLIMNKKARLPTNFLFIEVRSFLGLDRNQSVLRLPLLIGVFPACYIQKLMIILGRILRVPQVIVCRSAQEEAHRIFRKILGTDIRRLDRHRIILVFARCDRQLAVGFTPMRVQLDCLHQLLLGIGRLLFLQVDAAQP